MNYLSSMRFLLQMSWKEENRTRGKFRSQQFMSGPLDPLLPLTLATGGLFLASLWGPASRSTCTTHSFPHCLLDFLFMAPARSSLVGGVSVALPTPSSEALCFPPCLESMTKHWQPGHFLTRLANKPDCSGGLSHTSCFSDLGLSLLWPCP